MNQSTDSKNIFRSFFIIGGLLVLVKFIGLIKEIYLGNTFGISYELDSYYLALTIATFIPAAIVSAIPPILVPRFIKEKDIMNNTTGVILLFCAIVSFLLAGTYLIFNDIFLNFYNTDSNSKMIEATSIALNYFSVLPLLIIFISVFSSYLIANEKDINSILELIPSTIIIAFVFFLSTSLGYISIVFGHLLGSFTHLILLIVVCLRLGFKFNFHFTKEYFFSFKEIGYGAVILLFGQFFMTFLGPIDSMFVVNFGEGSLTTYNYANRFIAILMSLGSVIILRVLLPRFTKINKDKRKNQSLLFSLIGFIIASIICFYMNFFINDLILFAFDGGNISPQELGVVIELTRVGLLQFPFFIAGLILLQVLIVQKNYFAIASVSIVNLIIKTISNIYFIEIYGFSGLMYAWIAMYTFSLLLIIILFLHHHKYD